MIDEIGRLKIIEQEVFETEHHFHTEERWWGALGAPDETNAIDPNVNRPFVAISGANTWGAAIPICGTADNPVQIGHGHTIFDPHRVLVTDMDNNVTPWRLRIIWGAGTSGDAITAEQWTEIMVVSAVSPGNRAGGVPVNIKIMRLIIGIKLWAQVWNATESDELSFFLGTHGYTR